MNIGKRAALYLLRKKGKSLSLLALLVLISSFVITGFTILTGTQTAAKTLRETVGASFQIRGTIQGGTLGEQGAGYQIESTPLTDDLVSQILLVDGIKAYNATTVLPGNSEDFFFPSGAPAGQFQGNSASEWNRDFVSGLYLLSDGRHITPEDAAVGIVSRRLAEENNLGIGDTVSLAAGGATAQAQIVGLYDIDEEREPSEDVIFIDHQTVSQLTPGIGSQRQFNSAVFYVTDPAELPVTLEMVKTLNGFDAEHYTISAQTSEYDSISSQLSTVLRLTTLLIVAVALVCAIILVLILTMRIRNRNHEAGILLSVGVPKREIIGQFLLEVVALTLIAFTLSYPIGSFASGQIGMSLLSGLADVNLSFSVDKVILQYALELAAAIATVLVASFSVIQLKPKDILSQMS